MRSESEPGNKDNMAAVIVSLISKYYFVGFSQGNKKKGTPDNDIFNR